MNPSVVKVIGTVFAPVKVRVLSEGSRPVGAVSPKRAGRATRPLIDRPSFGSNTVYVLAHLGIAFVLARLVAGRHPRGPVDFRFVLLGSMIADLIDKPIGFGLGIGGRAAAHTAAFAVGLTLLAFGVHMRGRSDFLWLAFGHWTHLLLDGMWEAPEVLLYPAFGWTFPPETATVLDLLLRIQDPVVLGGEILGAVLLAVLAHDAGLTSWAAVKRFVRSGELPSSGRNDRPENSRI
jgi:inner membrane protein